MVWLPSQLAARLYAGLDERVLGGEGDCEGDDGDAHEAIGVLPQDRSMAEGIIGRKCSEKDGDRDEDASISRAKEKKTRPSPGGAFRYLFIYLF